MLRTSSYTIYVDLPGDHESMLLVHGYTGAYDKVTQRVATWIRSLEAKRPPKPLYGDWTPEPTITGEVSPPSDTAIEVLRRRGYLTELSEDEERSALKKAVTKLHQHKMRNMPLYIFMPTYDCNLRCFYCFQDHMRTDANFRHLLHTISEQQVDRIFAAMPGIEAAHGIAPDDVPSRSIGLFGGEPLLEQNRPIVGYILDKALSLGKASFWAVTNGTELGAYRDLLGPGKIDNIQITLDGGPEEHDRRRIHADGTGSFDQIQRSVTMALELGTTVQIRVNIDRNNLDQLPIIARVVIENGWNRYRRFDVHAAPITPINDQTDRKTTFTTWQLREGIDALREEHEEMEVFRRPDESMKLRLRQIFDQKLDPTPAFKTGFCSAHDRMYIFDAFGHVYACWDKTGDPDIRIGEVRSDGEFVPNDSSMAMWRRRTAVSNPVCSKCRYLLHCGGGCAVLAEGQHGEMYGNHCDAFQKRFRASVAEAYHDFVVGAERREAPEQVCDQ